MKIYSKFKDYYDYAAGFFSEDRVWRRNKRFLTIRHKNEAYLTPFSNEVEDFLMNAWEDAPKLRTITKYRNTTQYSQSTDYTMLVGFCGKLYLCFAFHTPHKVGTPHFSWLQSDLTGTYTDLKTFLSRRKRAGKDEVCTYGIFSKPLTEQGEAIWHISYHTHPMLAQVFTELNTPVFIIKPPSRGPDKEQANLILDACLADFKLQASFDPYTAYQEIDMFLGNQLAQREDATLDRTDDLIRDSKGFDDWSFKQKGPKKRKQK